MTITNVNTVYRRSRLYFGGKALDDVITYAREEGEDLRSDFTYEDSDCIVSFKCMRPRVYIVDGSDMLGVERQAKYKILKVFNKNNNRTYLF